MARNLYLHYLRPIRQVRGGIIMTIKFMYVHEFEHIALENYLNEMREKGYLLKGMGWFYLSFQKRNR